MKTVNFKGTGTAEAVPAEVVEELQSMRTSQLYGLIDAIIEELEKRRGPKLESE